MQAIAIDTETALASNSEPVPRLVSAAFAWSSGSDLRHWSDPETESRLAYAFEHCIAVFANAPFDVFVLLRAYPGLTWPILKAYHEGRIVDVLTREKMFETAVGIFAKEHNLGAVAERRAGYTVDKNDPWRKRYVELIGTPIYRWPPEAIRYAIEDARATFAVHAAQERVRQQVGPWTAFDGSPVYDVWEDAPRQAQAHLALYGQTLRGLYTDPDRVARLFGVLDRKVLVAADELYRDGLVRIEGVKRPRVVANTKVQQAILKRDARAPLIMTTRGPSLSEEALEKADLPEGHILHRAREMKATRALKTKWLCLERPWVRTRYQECVESGRTSSSGPQGRTKIDKVEPWEWVGSNFQNWPREGDFRSCIVPPPGYRYVTADYKGAELVSQAQNQIDRFGRSALADALRSGVDAHAMFACDMLGIDLSAYDKGTPRHKLFRQGAKAWNFGKPGLMGRQRFQGYAAAEPYFFVVTDEQYYQWDRQWLQRFPEQQLSFEYVRRLQDGDGVVTIVHHRSNRVRKTGLSNACNSTFQGATADGAKAAMWWMLLDSLDPSSPLFAGPLLVDPATGRVPLAGQALFVHDEIVNVALADRAESARVRQKEIMISAFGQFHPDVPVEVEDTISERYEKP